MLAPGAVAPAVSGQPVACPALLVFFKADCPACHLALRYVDALARSIASEDRVVAVSQDERDSAGRLLRSLGADLPLRLDHDLRASIGLGLEVVPALVLVDASGRIAASTQGFDKAALNRVASDLAKLLGVPFSEPVRAGDGCPDFLPGCVSRHLEPGSEAAGADSPELYSRRAGRATRINLPAEADAHEWCYAHGYADPLPVIPPTVARVESMLAASGLAPAEVVAHVPPNYGAASVEKIAANAVMAGCRPEYMRVLVPAVRALCDERLDIHGVQGTTHFAAPLAVLNGPVRLELGFACGSNLFSNAARANSTIGRALQLILRNLGGAAPGRIDMSTLGNPGRFSSVVGENEEASPWGPLAADLGIAAGRNAITFFCAEPPRAVSEHKARDARVVLRAICPVLANLWSHRVCQRSEALVVIGPEHASTLRRGGFAKDDVIGFLFENTGVPLREYDDDGGEGTHEAGSYDECLIRGVRCYRKFAQPESIRVMVAGGPAGKFSAVLGSWATGPRGSQMVSHEFA